MDQVKVSVIMPSLNVEAYIEECLKSVMGQSLKEIEIISVDAGSTDGTKEILQKYAKEDNRILLLSSEQRSYGKQVNMALNQATGEYIAILETDDIADTDMYAKLYETAKKNELDFIQADFDVFFSCSNGSKIQMTNHVFADQKHLYNKVLGHKDLVQIQNANSNLWRGIFSRQFLRSNNIWLNETKGAAYQDIRFMHLVNMCATAAMYVPESYYRYRTDRDQSSVNSPKGLQYAHYEYQKMMDEDSVKKDYNSRFYYAMVCSFLGETAAVLPRLDYVWNEENKRAYDWFKNTIENAIEDNILMKEWWEQETWTELSCLLKDREKYAKRLMDHSITVKKCTEVRDKKIVIFGAGQRGVNLFGIIEDKNTICAFCDNNSGLWGQRIGKTEILSINNCIDKYSDALYMIANKLHGREIREQLLSEGIKDSRILEYQPTIDWDLQ